MSIILLSVSCDGSASVLPKEELKTLYNVSLMQEKTKVQNGGRVTLTQPLQIFVEDITAAQEAAALYIDLLGMSGKKEARLVFTDDKTAIDGATLVKTVTGELPPIKLPETLSEGYYIIKITIVGKDGTELSSFSRHILICSLVIPNPSLVVYPGTIVSDRVFLVKLDRLALPEGLNPWVQWNIDGKEISSGFYKEKADRMLWRTPKWSGMARAEAYIFPYKPPNGVRIPPFAKAEISIPWSTDTGRAKSLASASAWSYFPFDGVIEDIGKRPQKTALRVEGKPYFEAFSSEYGCFFDKDSRIVSDFSILPVQGKEAKLEPFTVLCSFAIPEGSLPQNLSGQLLNIKKDNGDELFSVIFENGYILFKRGTFTVKSSRPLLAAMNRIAIQAGVSENTTLVSLYIDEQAVGQGTVGVNIFNDKPGVSIIADGCPLIYDELYVMKGAFQAHRIAEEYKRAESFICASAFENSELGPGLLVEGTAKPSIGSLKLSDGSRLIVDVPISKSEMLALDVKSGIFFASIELNDGKRLSICSDGSIWIDGHKSDYAVQIDEGQCKLGFEKTENAIIIYGSNDTFARLDALPSAGTKWIIEPISKQTVVLSKITNYSFDFSSK